MSEDPRILIEAEPNRRRPTIGGRETSKVAARETALSWARASRTGLGRWGCHGEGAGDCRDTFTWLT
jgi:hypothetical protein